MTNKNRNLVLKSTHVFGVVNLKKIRDFLFILIA